jgi:transposase
LLHGDAQTKGQLDRQHRFLRSNFEPRRFFANHLDFQDQLDRWAKKVNGRSHRAIRGIPAERLAKERQ